MPAEVQVEPSGVTLTADGEAVLDVMVEGRRVWSFHAMRDTERRGGERKVAWPAALRPFLTGPARVSLVDHQSGAVLFDAEVRLGPGQGRVRVADSRGEPLGLDKNGRLHRVFADVDDSTIDSLMGGLDDVLAVLDESGVPGFLAYGTLLGAVREGALLAHDSDIDVAYLSRHESPALATLESYQLERAMRARGHRVRRSSGLAFKVSVRDADGRPRGIDVFGALLVGPMLYVMGQVGASTRREQVLPRSQCALHGRTFPAPADPAHWLAATYGPSWQVPDPAFKFAPDPATKRRLRGWFSYYRRRRFWGEHVSHSESARLRDVDPFAAWVLACEPQARLVADLGCGTGADALAIARGGHHVVGLDLIAGAFSRAAQAARSDHLDATFGVVDLSDARVALATGAELALQSAGGPPTTLVRLVAECLGESTRHNLWRTLRAVHSGGGRTYMLTLDPDAEGAQTFARRRRMAPLAPRVVVDELAAHGARAHAEYVTDEREANGSRTPGCWRWVVSWRN